MLVFKLFRVSNIEYVSHIVHSVLPVFVSLASGELFSIKVVGHNRPIEYFGYCFTNQFTLVVASLAFASSVQRYWYYVVYIIKTVGLFQLHAQHGAILICHSRIAMVFDLVNNGLCDIPLAE